jgi:hypothetical protein
MPQVDITIYISMVADLFYFYFVLFSYFNFFGFCDFSGSNKVYKKMISCYIGYYTLIKKAAKKLI